MMLIHILENERIIVRIHDQESKWCVESVPSGPLTIHRTHDGGVTIYRQDIYDKFMCTDEAFAVEYIIGIVYEFVRSKTQGVVTIK